MTEQQPVEKVEVSPQPRRHQAFTIEKKPEYSSPEVVRKNVYIEHGVKNHTQSIRKGKLVKGSNIRRQSIMSSNTSGLKLQA